MEHRGPERLEQVEDELRVDELSRRGTNAFGDDQRAAGSEGSEDLSEREVEVARHVEGVHGVDERHAPRQGPLLAERPVHVQGCEAGKRRVREACLDGLLPASQEGSDDVGEPILADVSPAPRQSQALQEGDGRAP